MAFDAGVRAITVHVWFVGLLAPCVMTGPVCAELGQCAQGVRFTAAQFCVGPEFSPDCALWSAGMKGDKPCPVAPDQELHSGTVPAPWMGFLSLEPDQWQVGAGMRSRGPKGERRRELVETGGGPATFSRFRWWTAPRQIRRAASAALGRSRRRGREGEGGEKGGAERPRSWRSCSKPRGCSEPGVHWAKSPELTVLALGNAVNSRKSGEVRCGHQQREPFLLSSRQSCRNCPNLRAVKQHRTPRGN